MSKINSIIFLDFKCLKQRTKLSFYYQYICFHPSRFDSQKTKIQVKVILCQGQKFISCLTQAMVVYLQCIISLDLYNII